jgi:hypothetical protein
LIGLPLFLGGLLLLYAIIVTRFARWRHSFMGLLVPALLWLALPLWNWFVLRHACSGDCNIRIDLVLIAPLLAIATALAVVTGRTLLRDRRETERSGNLEQ